MRNLCNRIRPGRLWVLTLVVGVWLSVACGTESTGGTAGQNPGNPGVAAGTGSLRISLEDPETGAIPAELQKPLSFTGLDDSNNVTFGPVTQDAANQVSLSGVPVGTTRLLIEDPSNPDISDIVPVIVEDGQANNVTDIQFLADRDESGTFGPSARDGQPVAVGKGFIQTKRVKVDGANAAMAGVDALSVTSSFKPPYRTNTWVTPILYADNQRKVYLGGNGVNYNPPLTIFQEAVYPRPWNLRYNYHPPVNPDASDTGLLIRPENVHVVRGYELPKPTGNPTPGGDQGRSGRFYSKLDASFTQPTFQIRPGFIATAIKVAGMGDYSASFQLRAQDDPNFDKTGLSRDAGLTMWAVRGGPFLYFRTRSLPEVDLFSIHQGAATTTQGSSTIGGKVIDWFVITGLYTDNRTLSTALFIPRELAGYTPSPASLSTITFKMPATGYFALCTLPDASFGDQATMNQLAAAAFSFPVDSQVTVSYDQATQVVTETYQLVVNNVLGLPRQTVNGLLPHHYLPSPVHNNDPILQPGPTRLTNGGGTPMAYTTVRGKLIVYQTGTEGKFTCKYPYPGVLPWLPPLDASDATGRAELRNWREVFSRRHSAHIPPWTNENAGPGQDAYNLAKFLERNVLAAATIEDNNLDPNDPALARTIRDATRNALQLYFRKTPTLTTEQNLGQAPYYLWYDARVSSLNQYPAKAGGQTTDFPSDTTTPPWDGFGSISRLNDHHFHYGYWIYAAAELAFRDQQWGQDYKEAINEFIFDTSNTPEINPDPKFEYPNLRNWDAYHNHGQAAGFTFPFTIGNNEESISEELNYWAGIILWGAATGQDAIMNHGIEYYTLAVHSSWIYWFDIGGRYREIIKEKAPADWPVNWPGDGCVTLADGETRWETFFGSEPANCRGIVLIPVTGASFYHAMNVNYILTLMAAYDAFVGPNDFNIDPLHPVGNDAFSSKNQWLGNLYWYAHFAKYCAMADPANALTRYYMCPANYDAVGPDPKIIPNDKMTDVGDSGVWTYHWVRWHQLHGQADPWVKATNSPFFMTFFDKATNKRTYVVFNHTGAARDISFSDGTTVTNVAPRSLGVKTVP